MLLVEGRVMSRRYHHTLLLRRGRVGAWEVVRGRGPSLLSELVRLPVQDLTLRLGRSRKHDSDLGVLMTLLLSLLGVYVGDGSVETWFFDEWGCR